MNHSRVRSVISWVIQILLAALYILASFGKLISRPQVIERFGHWGFPDKFYLVIGVLELLGALGLLIPLMAGFAAAGLIVLMIGATATHLTNGEGLQVLNRRSRPGRGHNPRQAFLFPTGEGVMQVFHSPR